MVTAVTDSRNIHIGSLVDSRGSDRVIRLSDWVTILHTTLSMNPDFNLFMTEGEHMMML